MASSSATGLLEQALALHRRGALTEAARCYAAVLQADPGNSDANYYLGLLSCHSGGFAEGADFARKSLASDPQSAQACVLLGRALGALGHQEEALASFDRAIILEPKLAQAHASRADALSDLGRPADAVESYDKALQLAPDVVEDWFNRGVALCSLGRLEEAAASFDKAVALKPNLAQARLQRSKVLCDLHRYHDAFADLDEVLRISPGFAEAWLGRAIILKELKRYEESSGACDRALAIKPDYPEALLCRANLSFALRRYNEALAVCDQALALNPNLPEAWFGRGNVLFALERYDDAGIAYEKTLHIRSDFAEALIGRANVLLVLKQYDGALRAFDSAVSLRPDLADAWAGRGNVLVELRRYGEALAACDRALALKPDSAEAWLGRANVSFNRRQYAEALTAFDRATSVQPGLAEAWVGRSNTLVELRRYSEALADCDRALAVNPNLAEAWLGRAAALFNCEQYDEALSAYEHALELKPDFTSARLLYASALSELRHYDRAFIAFDKAMALGRDAECAEGARLLAKLHTCDWAELEADTKRLLSHIREGKNVSDPFALLALPSSAADQMVCAGRFLQDLPVCPPIRPVNGHSHDRIRIAYLSADFGEHPLAYLIAGLFEHHDRSRFEVTGLSFCSSQNSPTRNRVESALEHFLDIQMRSDDEVADLIRELKFDVVVDLMGHTRNTRFRVLAQRPAPVQVFYLGYAGTLGANFIDYILADPTVVPEKHRQFYTEQVVWLPDSYLVNDDRRVISQNYPTRRECGLPESGFVYCSFNNSYKINPETFQIWMRLLGANAESVLWLSELNPPAQANLRREAERHGVAPQRLIFAPRLPEISQHLGRQRQADLFLDTLPYNAHTTAADALWAGLPVLTCLGETFAGRVAGSLLKAVGLPELITTSLEDYEALALKLSREPALLASIKAKLAHNRHTYPLFNTARFTRHIEAAYATMWDRYERGEPPKGFTVRRID